MVEHQSSVIYQLLQHINSPDERMDTLKDKITGAPPQGKPRARNVSRNQVNKYRNQSVDHVPWCDMAHGVRAVNGRCAEGTPVECLEARRLDEAASRERIEAGPKHRLLSRLSFVVWEDGGGSRASLPLRTRDQVARIHVNPQASARPVPEVKPESPPRFFICDPDRKGALEPVAPSN